VRELDLVADGQRPQQALLPRDPPAEYRLETSSDSRYRFVKGNRTADLLVLSAVELYSHAVLGNRFGSEQI
jgi:hypothetical protein